MTGAEKLEIWQKTIAFAETVYALTTGFPTERRQKIRRAVVSIASNVAEGSACGSRREFARFVEIATAALPEAKRTPELLPLAHVIGVHGASVDLAIVDDGVELEATVRTADRTGVEMEALTAVTVAALAIVDMVKGLDKATSIQSVRLVRKTGGKSGDWTRAGEG